jgi:PAS domain S-box-containing protein
VTGASEHSIRVGEPREDAMRAALFYENSLEGFAYCRMLRDDSGRPVDFVYLSVNPTFERLTGLRNVAGKRVTEVLPTMAAETPELLELYGAVAGTGEPAEFEIDFTPLGLWLRVSAFRPEPEHFVAVFADVTERKHLERELDEERLRYRSLVENSSEAILLTRPDGTILTANPEACRMFGRSEQELRAVGRAGLVDATDPRLVSGLKERERTGIANGELRLVRSDGTTFLGAVSTRIYADHDGEERTSMVIHDLTEREAAEAALHESEELYRSILKASPDDITVTDLEGRVLLVSPAAVSMLGHEREEEMLGRLMLEFLVPEDRERAQANVRLMFEGVYTGPGEYLALRADRSTFPIEANAEFIRDAEGQPTGIVFVVRDVTERKLAENEIRRLNAELELRIISRTEQRDAATRELEAFAYSVSHDVRTPLRTIDGFSAMVLADDGKALSQASVEHLERVRSAAQRMALLLDEVLGLSRVSRRDLGRSEVDLSALARDVAEELHSEQRARAVEVIVAPGMGAEADPAMARMILRELLGNAWKFTSRHESARIEVGVTGGQSADTFYVRDDGAGFDMRYADHLFGAFQRMHTPEEFEGTGIGLATVQRLVTRHGGRVWAEAEVEKGATFYFTLPAPTAPG